MNAVLVTGGTGRAGRGLVPVLRSSGYDVRVASRTSGLDLVSGAGLDAAVAGVDAVVHLATTNGRRDVDMMANLVTTLADRPGRAEEPPHLLYLSIVGSDRIPLPYYRHKHAAERLALGSGLPVTVLRSTQFHPLVAQLFTAQRRLPVLLTPSIPLQPVDVGDVAVRVVELLGQGARGRVPDIGGPEVSPVATFAAQWQDATGHRSPRLPVRLPGRTFAAYREGGHLVPGDRVGGVTFGDFVRGRAGRDRS